MDQACGKLNYRSIEVRKRHNSIDKPQLQSLLRIDDVAHRQQLKRLVIANQFRQKVSTAAIRHQPNLHKNLAKERLLRCNDQIGTGRARIARIVGFTFSRRDLVTSKFAMSCSLVAARSAPEQKESPAPLRITTRVPSSAEHFTAANSNWTVSPSTELRRA